PGNRLPDHERAGGTDIDRAEMLQFCGELGRPEGPVAAHIDASQKNHECQGLLQPAAMLTASSGVLNGGWKCRMRNAKCGMQNAECKMPNDMHSSFRIPHFRRNPDPGSRILEVLRLTHERYRLRSVRHCGCRAASSAVVPLGSRSCGDVCVHRRLLG